MGLWKLDGLMSYNDYNNLFFFNLGYYHYQLVSEKLGFLQESRQWSRFDNPAEKFLTAFGEKENGTILKLVDASKQVGLTLFARKLEEKFGQTNQSREENEEDEGRICRVV